MAEERDDSDKTEDPTLKRLDEAVQRGDVAKSQEVNTWFVMAAVALVLVGFSGSLASGLTTIMRGLVANAHRVPMDRGGLSDLVAKLEFEILAATAIPFLLLVLAAIGGNMIQHRFVWSTEQLTPKLSKISPIAGAKRLFSKLALVNFLKGVAKLTLVAALMETRSAELIGSVVAVLAVIACLGFLFQYRQWFERQKMSIRELKEDFK